MVKYKAREITLSYEGQTILVNGVVARSINGESLIDIGTIRLSLSEMTDSHEIARLVLQAVRKVARKDFVTNVLFEEASDLILSEEFEFESES